MIFKSQLQSFSSHSDVDVAEARNPGDAGLHVSSQNFHHIRLASIVQHLGFFVLGSNKTLFSLGRKVGDFPPMYEQA